MTLASAAGKVILFGEHAVVYGRPAIAVPVSDVRATAEVEPGLDAGIEIVAQDLGCRFDVHRSYDDARAHPLQLTVRNTLEHLGISLEDQALCIRLRSEVPIARGMGSGTAVATALVRALAQHYGRRLDAGAVSDLVYRTEVLLHGTPSGVDNAVVAHEEPIYFRRGLGIATFGVGAPLELLIGDTGVPSMTRDTVAAVRRLWLGAREHHEALFDAIGATVDDAREAIASGHLSTLGALMDRNQALLAALGVSGAELDGLVGAARDAGALGAKLSGGGGGGCMIALVSEETRAGVAEALVSAGAVRVMTTVVR